MLILLFAFVAAQLAVALWLVRRIGSEDDFLVAGRKLGPALAATSIFATWFGAESCVGAAGAAYEGGWTWNAPEPIGYGVCLILTGVFFCHPEKPLDEGPPFSSRPHDLAHHLDAHFDAIRFQPVTAEFEGREGVEWSGIWRART